MRRHHALIATGLAVALSGSAIAGPGKPRTDDTDETFQAFTVTSRARLGVMVLQLTPELREYFGVSKDRGVLIGRVEPSSAAAAAGLAVGDIITEVRGERIEDASDVIAALAPAKKDEKVTISVIRDKQGMSFTAAMRDEPRPAPRAMRFPMRWFQEMFDNDAPPPAPRKST